MVVMLACLCELLQVPAFTLKHLCTLPPTGAAGPMGAAGAKGEPGVHLRLRARKLSCVQQQQQLTCGVLH